MKKNYISKVDKEIFEELKKQFNGIECLNLFDQGSTARVYHVRLPVGPDMDAKIDRVIKVYRTKIELTTQIDPHDIFQNEITKLITVSHTNVVSVFAAGYLKNQGEDLPFYIMEYLQGAKDLDEWIKSREKINRETIIQLFIEAASGIEALHKNDIIHCDLKFGNIFVGESGQVKIADLGFAKRVDAKPGKTGLLTSHKYFPRCYYQYQEVLDDKRQMHALMPRECINSSFDLHYFGQTIHDIITIPVIESLLTHSDIKSFNLIIERTNLDSPSVSLPKYDKMGQVIKDLEKMRSIYLNPAGIEELSTYTGTKTIRIPVTGSIPFTKRISELIHHPTFFRLNDAHQLGFTHYVFPGANHTRLEHSIGVYSNVARYISSLLADDYQPYFRQLVDEEMIATALLAGLLHDIGQNSYSHSLEDMGLSQSHEDIAKMFITGQGMNTFFNRDEHKHPLKDTIIKLWPEVNLDRLIWLITGKKEKKQSIGLGWEIVRAILSGPIDADKTDYLLRDAHHSGVEYARSIDIKRFMNSLTASLAKNHKYIKGVLAITWKGYQSAENIVLARSQMFWVLYWHHAVRSAHAMMAHACASHIETLNDDEKGDFNDILYWGSMGEFASYLQKSKNVRAKSLSNMIRIRRLFKRMISLDYEDDRELYECLLNKKLESENNNDKLLYDLSRDIALQVNKEFKGKGLNEDLQADDIIVDIPRADKDKLGQIYVVEKEADYAIPYKSMGLSGNLGDWQNRVRTIRIFVDPKVDKSVRQLIGQEGRRILQYIV